MFAIVANGPEQVPSIFSVLHNPELVHGFLNSSTAHTMTDLDKNFVEQPIVEVAVRFLIECDHVALEFAALIFEAAYLSGLTDKVALVIRARSLFRAIRHIK